LKIKEKNFILFRALKERLRSHVEFLTRQARLKTMKKGQIFMTIESRIGAKKTKSNYLIYTNNKYSIYLLIDRLMYWQLLDNEKHVQCSESPTTTTLKENNTRDNSTTNLTRTMSMLINKNLIDFTIKFDLVPLENIKDVQCNIDQSRSGNINTQERVPKLPRHVNKYLSLSIIFFFFCLFLIQ
jgi:hypothetical protein